MGPSYLAFVAFVALTAFAGAFVAFAAGFAVFAVALVAGFAAALAGALAGALRGFEGTISKGLGLDRFPELRDVYFANYNRLIYLVQQEDAALIAKAHLIAARLGLPLELQRTGYGQLEQRLVDLMAEIHAPRYAPVLADVVEEAAAPPKHSSACSKTQCARSRIS